MPLAEGAGNVSTVSRSRFRAPTTSTRSKSRPKIVSRSRAPAIPATRPPSVPKAPPGPQTVSASKFGKIYPQLSQNAINAVASAGVTFQIDPNLALGGTFDARAKRITLLPGQPIGSAAHELTHAVQAFAPNLINRNVMTAKQRRDFDRTVLAYQAYTSPLANLLGIAIGGPGEVGKLLSPTGPAEELAFSISNATGVYPTSALNKLFSAGRTPYELDTFRRRNASVRRLRGLANFYGRR